MADDIYIDADGRRHIGRPPEKAPKAPRGFVSELWPPPGHPDAAHRPECGRDGRGCICAESEPERGNVIAFPRRSS